MYFFGLLYVTVVSQFDANIFVINEFQAVWPSKVIKLLILAIKVQLMKKTDNFLIFKLNAQVYDLLNFSQL